MMLFFLHHLPHTNNYLEPSNPVFSRKPECQLASLALESMFVLCRVFIRIHHTNISYQATESNVNVQFIHCR